MLWEGGSDTWVDPCREYEEVEAGIWIRYQGAWREAVDTWAQYLGVWVGTFGIWVQCRVSLEGVGIWVPLLQAAGTWVRCLASSTTAGTSALHPVFSEVIVGTLVRYLAVEGEADNLAQCPAAWGVSGRTGVQYQAVVAVAGTWAQYQVSVIVGTLAQCPVVPGGGDGGGDGIEVQYPVSLEVGADGTSVAQYPAFLEVVVDTSVRYRV